jgi:hypothetical protein
MSAAISNMLDRGSRIAESYSPVFIVPPKTVLILLVLAFTVLLNLRYFNAMPQWVEDIDLAEGLMVLLALLILPAGYASFLEEKKRNEIGFEMGFERGRPFGFAFGGERVAVDRAWKYGASRSFGISPPSAGTLKVAYEGAIDEPSENRLKAEPAVSSIARFQEAALLEVSIEATIDDLRRIIDMMPRA